MAEFRDLPLSSRKSLESRTVQRGDHPCPGGRGRQVCLQGDQIRGAVAYLRYELNLHDHQYDIPTTNRPDFNKRPSQSVSILGTRFRAASLLTYGPNGCFFRYLHNADHVRK
jgi:hypothetical protein